MQALNFWVEPNSRFHKKLISSDKKLVIEGISEVLASYKVARSFKNIEKPGKRYWLLFSLVNKRSNKLKSNDVVSSVKDLASDIEKKYGQYAISAASKLMWFYSRGTVVIYDELARAALEEISGIKIRKSDYEGFYRLWHLEYKKNKTEIAKSSIKLPSVKSFSMASDIPDKSIFNIVESRWFQKRVFDYYLWHTGERLKRDKK